MKRKKNKKSKKTSSVVNNKYFLYSIIIFLVILLIIIGVSFSYAFWISTDNQTNTNDVNAGCLSFTYFDQDVDGNVTNISMKNSYPMSDIRGLATKPYVFTITNTCNLSLEFNIYVNRLATSNLSSSYIKYSLEDSNNSIKLGPDTISNLDTNTIADIAGVEAKVGSIDSSYLMHSVKLIPEEAITLYLRLWIDYEAPNEIMQQSFNAAVSVEAIPKN